MGTEKGGVMCNKDPLPELSEGKRFQINLSKTLVDMPAFSFTPNDIYYTLFSSLWTHQRPLTTLFTLAVLWHSLRPLNRLWCGQCSSPLLKSAKLRLHYASYISWVIILILPFVTQIHMAYTVSIFAKGGKLNKSFYPIPFIIIIIISSSFSIIISQNLKSQQ